MDQGKFSLEISWNTLFRAVIFIGLIFLFISAREALGVFLVSIILSLGLDPLVTFFEERKFGRLLGSVIVFLGGILVISGILYLVVPIIVDELTGFLSDFNNTLFLVFGIKLPKAVIEGVSVNLSKILSFLSANQIPVNVAVSVVLKKALLVLAAMMSAFYLSLDKFGTERLLRVILPDVYERPVLTVFARFKLKIRRWFGAQLGLSLIVGVVVTIGLWILKVKYALVLGLMAAVFEIVPVIGPIIAGSTAFLVAVSNSLSTGLYAAAFFVIVQQLESHVLIPFIMGKTMKVHPVIVIISLLAGAEVAGFVGIVLAVPIAVMAQEIYNYMEERKGANNRLKI